MDPTFVPNMSIYHFVTVTLPYWSVILCIWWRLGHQMIIGLERINAEPDREGRELLYYLYISVFWFNEFSFFQQLLMVTGDYQVATLIVLTALVARLASMILLRIWMLRGGPDDGEDEDGGGQPPPDRQRRHWG